MASLDRLFFYMGQEELARPMSTTLFAISCMVKGLLFFVLLHLELLHCFLLVAELHTPASKYPLIFMSRHCVESRKTLNWLLLSRPLIWLYGIRPQCKVVIYMRLLIVHSKIFEAVINHLEVCVLSLEETLSKYFLLSSKEIGLKLLESLCSALLFGSPFIFSGSHRICGLIQQMNTSVNLHNGS